MDKFLESLVNDGLPEPGEAREEAMFLMLCALVQTQIQTAKGIEALAEAIGAMTRAITMEDKVEDDGDPVAATGWGGLDG